MIYQCIEGSDAFYASSVDSNCRSRMNIPFTIKGNNEQLTKKFLAEAEKSGMLQLEGHKAVGGCRASVYNGMDMAGVKKLVDFMKDFATKNK